MDLNNLTKSEIIKEYKKLQIENNSLKLSLESNLSDFNIQKKALSESLIRHEKSHRIARLAFIEWDLKTNKVYRSKELREIYGLNPSEDYDQSIESMDLFVHPDDLGYVRENLNLAMKGLKEFNVDYRILKKDGEIVWLQGQAELKRDESGNPHSLLGTVIDISSRKKIEEELRIAHGEITNVLERMNDAFISFDKQGQIIYCNTKALSIFGFNKKKIIGKSIWNELPNSNGQNLKTNFEKAVQKNSFIKFEEYYPYYDKWFENRINPTDNGIAIFFTDITESKQAALELKENERKLRNILEYSTNLFYEHDNNHQILYISPQVKDILGYNISEAYVKWTEFVTDNPINDLGYEKTMLAIHSGKPQTPFELELHHRDGRKIWVEVREAPVVENGKTISIVGSLTDITERKVAEVLLKAEKERYQKLVQNIPVGVFRFRYSKNKKRAFDYISPRACKIFGIKEADVYRDYRNAFNVIHPEEVNNFYHLNRKIFRTNKPFIWEGRGVINGQTRWIRLESRPTAIEDGDMVTEGVVSDITERVLAEKELIKAKEKAEESDHLKSAFLATMSHELRTPLNAIIGFSQIIDKDLPIENILDFVKIIHSSGAHLLSIVQDIFDTTLIEMGEAKIQKEEVKLITVLNEVEEIIEFEQLETQKSNLEIELIVPPAHRDIVVYTDAQKLKQILINLLKNALKFTHEGYVKYGFTLEYDENKPYLKVFVKDSGIGIPLDKQNMIFDMFRQVEDTHTRQYGGTGIGLSIVKKITKLLGGEIWVESSPGNGSCFYFTLTELISENHVQPTDFTSGKQNIFTGKTILIAEDDPYSYSLLEAILKPTGAVLIHAADGEEATNQCMNCSFINLVLLDLNMPKKNGYDVAREIKSFWPELPIIAQTAYANMGDKEKILAAGSDDYISKPIDKNRLLELVSKYLK
jgi:PAS domain S-box-containing protein